MRIFYSDRYVPPLPPGHRFPMVKHAMLRARVTDADLVPHGALQEPQATRDEDILRKGNGPGTHGTTLSHGVWPRKNAGLGDSPRTILTELSRITAADVVLPLADGSGRELRLRGVVRPDRAQALLIDRLGLKLPERLRVAQTVEM